MKFVDEIKYRDFEFGETLENAEKVGGEIRDFAENEQLRKNIRFTTNGSKKEIKTLIKEIEKLIKETPWAMFSSEIRKMFGMVAGTAEDRILQKMLSELKIKKIRIQEIAKNFGYQQARRFFTLLEKSGSLNPRKIGHEPLLFLEEAQAMRRIILELHGVNNKEKPNWFKLAMHLSKDPREHTLQEMPDSVLQDKSTTSNIKGFPRIFFQWVDMNESKRGKGRETPVFLRANEDFYKEVYAPIKKWMTAEGYKVFEEWKQKYHWGRKL